MVKQNYTAHYTPSEERANVITHFIGIVFSLISFIFLLYYSVKTDSEICIFSSIVFAVSMLTLYTASTLYHSIKTTPNALHLVARKKNFRIFDHSSIYILISGSYTPFLLIPLHNKTASMLCVALWLCTFVCISLKLFFVNSFKILSTLSYVIMGWSSVFVMNLMYKSVPGLSFALIVLGGIFYTSGLIFYLRKKLLFHHAIWHVFVMAGSISHFFALLVILKNYHPSV